MIRKFYWLAFLILGIAFSSCGETKEKEPEYTDVEELWHAGKFIATTPGENGTPRYGVYASLFQEGVENPPKEVVVPFVYDYITKLALKPLTLSEYTDPTLLVAQKGKKYDLYTFDGDTVFTDFDDYEIVNNRNFGSNNFFNHMLIKKDGKTYVFFNKEYDNTYFPNNEPFHVFGPYDEIVATQGKTFFFREGDKWGAFKPFYHKNLSRLEEATDQNRFIAPEYDKLFSIGPSKQPGYYYYLGYKDGKWEVRDDTGEFTTDTYDSFKWDEILKMKINNSIGQMDMEYYAGQPSLQSRNGNEYVGHAYFWGDDYNFRQTERDKHTWSVMKGRLGPYVYKGGTKWARLNF